VRPYVPPRVRRSVIGGGAVLWRGRLFGTQAMTEGDPRDLNQFDAKLKAARDRIEGNGDQGSKKGSYNDSLAGVGYRMSIELVVGICVGLGLGWLIDAQMGTKPLFMLVLMFLGLVAGIFNVVRLSKDVQRRLDKRD
jgi:ATP synthase protein I